MPRIIYDPSSGLDVTASVQAQLLGSNSVQLCNLYTFANRVFWNNDPTGNIAFWTFTDADFPVAASSLQLFASGAVTPTTLNGGNILRRAGPNGVGMTYFPRGFSHSGLSYEVGLQAHDIDVTWLLDDTEDYFTPLSGAYGTLINPQTAMLPIKLAMAGYRAFDDCPFWIHRGVLAPYDPVWQGSLVGCFTDGTGQIVPNSVPFLIGRGIAVTVPPGATRLQMGMNDFPYSDNTGSWVINVNGTNVTVQSRCAPWVYTPGVLNTAYAIPSSGQLAPTVVAGMTPYQTIYISYVSGLCNLHNLVPPFFDSEGSLGLISGLSAPGQYVVSTKVPTYPALIGTTLMWRGFIRSTEMAPDYLKISLGSLMQILQDTQVPGQVVQPNARTSPFLPFPQIATATLTPFPSAGLIVRVTAKTYTMGGTGIAANQLQDCWVTFNPSAGNIKLAPQSGLPPAPTPGWRIQSNTAAVAGSLNITFYDPPIVPSNVQNINLYSPNDQSVGAPGFKYLPPPENSL